MNRRGLGGGYDNSRNRCNESSAVASCLYTTYSGSRVEMLRMGSNGQLHVTDRVD